MERRLNKKINDYVHKFKTDIVNRVTNLSSQDTNSNQKILDVTSFIYEYQMFEFNKDDFMKRKRVKNTVPVCERCCAKRASNEQCTRRRKNGIQYCGTHSKGTPHGIVSDIEVISTTVKLEVCAIDIKGIIYYLDTVGNVYDPDDIICNNINPRVIAKYEKHGEDYSIPELFST
jgi:hypothetical protein